MSRRRHPIEAAEIHRWADAMAAEISVADFARRFGLTTKSAREYASKLAEPMALVLFERPLHLPTFSWRREAAPVVGVADLFAGHEEHRADAERGVKESA